MLNLQIINTVAAYAHAVTNTPSWHAAFVALPEGIGFTSVRQVDAAGAGSAITSPSPLGEQRR